MGNNAVGFQVLLSKWDFCYTCTFLRSTFPYSTTTMAQQQRKSSSDPGFIAKYINEQNNSSDEEKEVEVFESPDYEPFLANFRKYKPELTQVEKGDILARGLINLRANPHMRDIMVKMFDYDLEINDIENEIFMVKEKIEPIFNFIDISFQLLDGPFEKSVALLYKQMIKLRNYYDRKATLNMAQSESIVDLFRFFCQKGQGTVKSIKQ